MAITVTEHVSNVRQRRFTLDSYLQRLMVSLPPKMAEVVSGSTVAVDGVDLPIDPWVVSHLDMEVEEGRGELSEVLWHTLALLLKSGIDAGRLRRATACPGTDLYALQAELMLDIGLGTALLRETHQTIDDLVRQGSLPDARRFGRVHHRLRSVVREMKQSIAESNRDRADPLGGDLAKDAAPRLAMPGEVSGVREEEQAASRRHVRGSRGKHGAGVLASVRPPLRTKVLFVLAGSSLVVWTVSVLMSLFGGQTPRELSLADFVRSAPIVEIVARPPSLYVSIDENVWSGYDEIQKRHLVNDMGSVLLTNGYWGLLLRSQEGKPLAEWLENGGARLLDGKEERPAAARESNPGKFDRFVR